jgi:hypothetical protein
MNYKNEDITKRAEESPLWEQASRQRGEVLPYLLERYLLLENWRYRDRITASQDHGDAPIPSMEDVSYLHLLLAEATTVLLSQEQRIRELEKKLNVPNAEIADKGSGKEVTPGSAHPFVHCLENGPDDCSLCMLLDGHAGPHEFTPDDQIIIKLAPNVLSITEKVMASIRDFPCGHKPNGIGGECQACAALKEWDAANAQVERRGLFEGCDECGAQVTKYGCPNCMRSAIERVLNDSESKPGGWGPDITMLEVLRNALKSSSPNAEPSHREPKAACGGKDT